MKKTVYVPVTLTGLFEPTDAPDHLDRRPGRRGLVSRIRRLLVRRKIEWRRVDREEARRRASGLCVDCGLYPAIKHGDDCFHCRQDRWAL